ncbi:copper homeostasis protein CutC [Paractinoplanes atraurantiacus]|uniref:PF03932 family protein CutC n=1 Tax=Paractinoplanes atraurantiacus TaxID=1036182 RepID=A0A285KIT2_9ACTN|nr:copper homeostasis protein CutC [Actinoplanes atraurantiacus]SNY71211.1 copper homeostasis protein [Actinoplanes atraurantiacus]
MFPISRPEEPALSPVAFELAVQDTHGLEVAARLGADRIELCSALALGGVTPSLALVEAAAATPGIPPVHVLVRPRTGGFAYEPAETATILQDVRHVLRAGASGVVIGGIRDATVDTDLVKRVLDAAGDAPVTFHRAIDTLPDRVTAVETLAALGVRRVLTSAGATSVADALPALTALVAAAAGRIEIMAGGGVTVDLVPALLRTGVHAVHASAKRLIPDGLTVGLGTSSPAGPGGRETTDEVTAAAILAAIRSAGSAGDSAGGLGDAP